MEFSKEFIEQHGLNENQVNAISGHVEKEYLPNLKKEWDGKANADAEGILDGAVRYAQEKTGVELEREKGEKAGDYFKRLTDTYTSSQLSLKEKELEDRKKEIEDKLKNFKGSDELKGQLETLKAENDKHLKALAELEPLKGLDEKYRQATDELTDLQKRVAYNGVKPNFPEEVNKYEAKAKWDEFVKATEEKNTIEIDKDNEAWAVDKENHHKRVKLSELVGQDENIKTLLQGRQQGGTGAKPANLKEVEGVPFKVPENATSSEKTKLVKDHLIKVGVEVSSDEYTKKFTELYAKVSQKKSA